MAVTRIVVNQVQGRPRLSLSTGVLRPQPVHSPAGWARIGLLATTAVLLGGDAVELDVVVGPGARLDLFDVAGTVAFDGRGRAASWHTRLHVADGAVLHWAGQPFVVADGAAVTRSLEVDVGRHASVLLRDTVVLGRSGERGGTLRNRTSVALAGRSVLLEDQHLEPDLRRLPGLLGGHRVLDTITALGSATAPESDPEVSRFSLVDQAGTVTRHLGPDLAASPLHALWLGVRSAVPASGSAGGGALARGRR